MAQKPQSKSTKPNFPIIIIFHIVLFTYRIGIGGRRSLSANGVGILAEVIRHGIVPNIKAGYPPLSATHIEAVIITLPSLACKGDYISNI